MKRLCKRRLQSFSTPAVFVRASNLKRAQMKKILAAIATAGMWFGMVYVLTCKVGQAGIDQGVW